MKFGIVGATGRVGQLLIKIINEKNLELGSVIFEGNANGVVFPQNTVITNDWKTFLENCDVVIDFSAPVATEAMLTTAIENNMNKALVIATTGLNDHQKNLIIKASELMPVLYATNMSLGIAVLNKVVEQVSAILRDFDIEITEMHHRYKKDAPSGTALTLAEHCAKARNLDLDKVRVSGRDGIIGERSKDEIAVMALRGGDIVGRHTVGFYNDGEFLEFNHTATSRETFAQGAVKVATWLVNQKAGFYSINDALGL
jgi:4-hydroxy-tetrahydrodipicolinate reductase